jgi:hypothetical protein
LNEVIFKETPVIPILKAQEKPYIIKVNEILTAKKKDPDANTSALEAEIDRMVYELYGLLMKR